MGTVEQFAKEVSEADPDADKPTGDPSDIAKAPDTAQSNSPSAKMVDEIMPDLVKQWLDTEKIMEEAKKKCEPIRAAIKAQVKEVAKESGVSVKIINHRYSKAKNVVKLAKKEAQFGDDHQFENDCFKTTYTFDVESGQFDMFEQEAA